MNLKPIAYPLYQAKGWVKFLGVVMIINGVLTAFSIIGLIIAWLPIWLGVLLFQVANRAERAYHEESEQMLIASLARLKTYFVISGVLMVLYLLSAVGLFFNLVLLTGFSGAL